VDSSAPPAAPKPPERRGPSSAEALNALFVAVDEELRRVAHAKLGLERPGHTLSTTALIHETYLRLVKQDRVTWADRGQFLGLAAQAMRRILIDYARKHRKLRDQVTYESGDGSTASGDRPRWQVEASERSEEILALDEALCLLARVDERAYRVVECRFFAGLTEEETAQALGFTTRTIARDWVKARAWLYGVLKDRTPPLPT
jgi:RNA polymerase sigma factor (TIGR02999 family)